MVSTDCGGAPRFGGAGVSPAHHQLALPAQKKNDQSRVHATSVVVSFRLALLSFAEQGRPYADLGLRPSSMATSKSCDKSPAESDRQNFLPARVAPAAHRPMHAAGGKYGRTSSASAKYGGTTHQPAAIPDVASAEQPPTSSRQFLVAHTRFRGHWIESHFKQYANFAHLAATPLRAFRLFSVLLSALCVELLLCSFQAAPPKRGCPPSRSHEIAAPATAPPIGLQMPDQMPHRVPRSARDCLL